MKKIKKVLLIGSTGILLIIKFFLLDLVIIKGSSMEPTYFENDIIFINKNYKTLENGDVVVIKKDGKKYIKRIVGNEGTQISYKNNILKIGNQEISKGKYFDENLLNEKTELKKNEFFLLGDNREESLDSRYFGIINEKNIYGKIIIK